MPVLRLAVVAFVLTANTAFAQSVLFDPAEQLPGYEEAEFHDLSAVYDFAPFRKWENKRVDRSKFEELKSAWQAERARAEKRIQELESDPAKMAAYRVRKKLRKHPYFGTIELEEYRAFAPYVFLIQKPGNAEADYLRTVAARFQPWLKKMEGVFQATWATPAGLARNAAMTEITIVILASEGEYQNYNKALGQAAAGVRAHYDPELRVAVSYEEPYAKNNTTTEKIQTLVHEFVHAMQHAHAAGGVMPWQRWLMEGMAEYHENVRTTARSLDNPRIQDRGLKTLVSMIYSARLRGAVAPVSDLVGYRTYGDAVRAATVRTPGAPRSIGYAALDAFYAQSSLTVHFLMDGDGGKHRAGFLRYVARAFGGTPDLADWAALSKELGMSQEQFDAAFQRYLFAELKKVSPASRLRDPIALRVVGPRDGGAAAGSVAAEAVAPASLPEVALPCAALAPPAGDWRAVLGGALMTMGAGDYAGAAAAATAAQPPQGAEMAAFLKARTRLVDAATWIDEMLEGAKSSKKRVKFKIRGKLVQGTVIEMRPGILVIKSPSGRKKTEVSLSDVGLDQLVDVAKRLKVLSGSVGESAYFLGLATRADAAVLAKIEKASKGASAARSAFDEMEPWRQSAGPLATLGELAAATRPADAKAAQALVAKVARLLGEHGKTEVVTQRRDTLRAFTATVLRTAFDPATALPGAEDLGGGKMRWRWNFKEKGLPPGFSPKANIIQALSQGLPPVTAPRKAEFTARGGKLRAIGSVGLELGVPIQPPFEISYRIEYEYGPMVPLFWLGFCHESDRRFAVFDVLTGLIAVDAESNIGGNVPVNVDVIADHVYGVKIRHSGNDIAVTVDGKKVANADKIGKLKGGSVFLWAHTNTTVAVDDLVIEGKIRPDAMEGLERRWIEAELERLFGS